MAKIVKNIEELVGRTPLFEFEKFEEKHDIKAHFLFAVEADEEGNEITADEEYQQKMTDLMIKKAEEDGILHPGDTIVENTSGNTGIGLAAFSASRGYKLTVFLEPGQSEERQKKLDEFAFWNSQINRVKERWQTKDWSVNLATREKKLAEDEAFADASEKKEKELSKLNFKKEEVLLDSAKENAHADKDENSEAKKDDNGASPQDKLDAELASDEPPAFDVQLREALRIMADWIEILNKNKEQK